VKTDDFAVKQTKFTQWPALASAIMKFQIV